MANAPRVIRLRPRSEASMPVADEPCATTDPPVWQAGDPCHALAWTDDLATWDDARRARWMAEVGRLTGLEMPWGVEAAGYLAWERVRKDMKR